MDDWIDYYDSTHTIYASRLHRDLHFQIVAKDIVGYISSPDAVVLDYACGEALSAARVAEACGRLILAEPAPGVRGRLIARFAPNTRIKVRSLDELRTMDEKSVDLAVMNSVAQYMTPDELDAAFAVIRRLLKPGGRLIRAATAEQGAGFLDLRPAIRAAGIDDLLHGPRDFKHFNRKGMEVLGRAVAARIDSPLVPEPCSANRGVTGR